MAKSNEHDVQDLGRQQIGIDISPTTCWVIVK